MPNSLKSRLKSLEERLQAENDDRDSLGGGLDMYEQNAPSGNSNGGGVGGISAPSAVTMGSMPRPTPTLPLGNSNGVGGIIGARHRHRPTMMLPVTPGHHPATETETDKKLKKIMKQTGILTIDGHAYKTDIKDLEHLGDLGSGTSGNVVKMRHIPSGTVIAVKQMRRTGNTEENKRILMDLDVVLKSHDCDYIVQCLGCFVHDPDVWICMELMSMCFDKLLKLSRQPVPESILGKVTVATVKALWYLKDKHGVIHRDVKPSNILIDERGNIKLCDFGISGRLVDSKANTRSAGCAAYMAPERIDPKKPKYDIRADVWSLGITLVELATARSPYEGCHTDFEVLTKVLDSEPPSLPHGDGFQFSPEFHDFVTKCLTKNPQMRPKYPELLVQPFIKRYEMTEVDVPAWFKNIRTHHRSHMAIGGAGTAPALGGITTMTTKFHRSSIKQSSTTSTATTSTSSITMTTTTNQMTAMTTISAPKSAQSHIPSYQQTSTNLQQRYKMRDERDLPPPSHHHPQQLTHQPSQLPQPVGFAAAAAYKERENGHNSSRLYNNNKTAMLPPQQHDSAGGGSSSGSSSVTSLSPQSPPSIVTTTQSSYRSPKEEGRHGPELSRLYRKSPFMQRKYGGGSFKYNSGGSSSGGAGGESPKKESVLSSIGQSIIRNLTTSPFAQKKHQHNQHLQSPSNPQPNQVDPLWRMPSSTQDFDSADGGGGVAATKIKTFGMDSPFAARKRYTGDSVGGERDGGMNNHQQPQQTSLIPLNRNESNPASQRVVQGNQSPIVLQRFYHQQNQLREKELEKERYQQQQHYSTNPFLPTYNANSFEPPLHHHQQSHIPVPSSSGGYMGGVAASSSSQSTSSQSSTQSTSSQINTYELRRRYDNASPPPPTAPAGVDSLASLSPTKPRTPPPTATAIFGVGSSHLQYQPLPQHQQQSHYSQRNSSKNGAAEPQRDFLEAAGEGLSKLEKLYGRRSTTSTHCSSSDSGIGSGNGGGNGNGHAEAKDGWFNTFAGAMKRQFASYVKLQLNSTGSTAGAPQRPTHFNDKDTPSTSSKSHFYRSSGGASSNSTSPTTSAGGDPHQQQQLPLSKIPCSADFHENSGAGTFLRRYANGAMAGNPHLMAGLDRRHRSPDPPPRYNRGQSPLLLRKNLLELSGQPPGGSPMLQRRYVSASPPLPPPRRGSESVPGSPQHFRTRIHYTPEPQRRIYRTIDQ